LKLWKEIERKGEERKKEREGKKRERQVIASLFNL